MSDVQFSVATQNAVLNTIRDRIDSGGAAGELLLYSGTQPSAGGAPVGGVNVLLAQMPLGFPSAPNASSGTLTFDITTLTTTGLASGDAVWGRIQTSTGTYIVDLVVGDGVSSAPIRLSSITIALGGTVEVQTAVINFNS